MDKAAEQDPRVYCAVVRHFQLIRELSSGNWQPGRVSKDAVVLGLLLAAAVVAMAVYLLLIR